VSNLIIRRLGDRQLAALDMYVFDVVHVEWRELQEEPQFPGSVTGSIMTIEDGKGDLAADMLTEAANDSEDDRELSWALTNLAVRVRKAGHSSAT
jgi:hypothetical protein